MAAITTDTVREAVRRHQTSPTVSAALGRVLTGTLLLGSSLKEFDRLTVKIESDGAVEGIVAEAIDDGKVRGYVKNPHAELPPKENGKFDVAGIIGKGMFYRDPRIGLRNRSAPRALYRLSADYIGRNCRRFRLLSGKVRTNSVRRSARCSATTEEPFVMRGRRDDSNAAGRQPNIAE